MTSQDGLAQAWPRAKAWLEPAIAYTHGTHDIEDVFRSVLAGNLMLIVGDKSALVTEVVTYPRLRALRFFLAGGDLEELRRMQDLVASRAREAGIGRVEFGGRPGWGRALDGYIEAGRYWIKDLMC